MLPFAVPLIVASISIVCYRKRVTSQKSRPSLVFNFAMGKRKARRCSIVPSYEEVNFSEIRGFHLFEDFGSLEIQLPTRWTASKAPTELDRRFRCKHIAF